MVEGQWDNYSSAKYTHVARFSDRTDRTDQTTGSALVNRIEIADRSGPAAETEIAQTNQKSMTSTTVNDFVGKSISLPSDWAQSDRDLGGQRSIKTFSAPDGSATLSLFDRGINIRQDTAKVFSNLLADNASIKGPKVLLPTEIRALADVMGVSNAGDNQYTNSHPYPNPQAAVFHLSSAQLLPVNGKVVLEVEGNYVDERGKAQKQYRGIFSSGGVNGASIKEFFLQSDDLVSFSKNQKTYSDALKSIKW